MSGIAFHQSRAPGTGPVPVACRSMSTASTGTGLHTVRETVAVGHLSLTIVRPRSAEDLISEEEYALDERLPYWAELWPSARVLAEEMARRATGREIETMLVDWRNPPAALLERAPFDLVIGADVLYEPRNGAALAALVPRLVPPGGELLITDPRRPDAVHLLEPLTAAGWVHEQEDIGYAGRRDESGSVVRLHRLRAPLKPGDPGSDRQGAGSR